MRVVMPATITEQEQGSEIDWQSWIKIVVAANFVFRIIAAIAFWFLLRGDINDWSVPSESEPLIWRLVVLLLPIFILLAILYDSWKERECDLQVITVLATIGSVISAILTIITFAAAGGPLGLIDGVINLINALLLAPLAYVIHRRIQEINHKLNAYPMKGAQANCGVDSLIRLYGPA